MNESKFLVVGALGQMGRQIVSLVGGGRAVLTSRENGHPGCIRMDLEELGATPQLAEKLVTLPGLTGVFCLGGMTDVERCESDPELAMRVNCHGPAALAAASAKRGVPFVYVSTEYVFDGFSGPYEEESAANPLSAYGKSKWQGELTVQRDHPQALVIRTTVVYGPDARGKNFLYSLRRGLSEGQEFRVPADQISTPTYNRDLAQATITLLETRASGVFHVCGPERLSRYEFAIRAARAMQMDPAQIVPVATAELGQRAPRPLSAGLATRKLSDQYPSIRMRVLEEAIADWDRIDNSL